MSEQEDSKLPVTVLSGFLGSGKTTLLKYVLQADHGMRIALIVNDMAAINIDAERAKLVQKEAQVVQMENGCICCTLREDLLVEIKKLALEKEFDYLLIESTGISEPLPIAETFTFGDLNPDHTHAEGNDDHPSHKVRLRVWALPRGFNASEVLEALGLDQSVVVLDERRGSFVVELPAEEAEALIREKNNLRFHSVYIGLRLDDKPKSSTQDAARVLGDVARLDTCVTVVDSKQFFDYLEDDDEVFERWGKEGTQDEWEDEQTVSKLLIDQIEFSNVILINKTDLVSEAELNRVSAMVKKLNPDAKVLKTQYCEVDLKEILNTNSFDLLKAQFHAGWLKELRGQHIPESEEYGISSFVMDYRKPLCTQRFHQLLDSNKFTEQVIRVKGTLWFDCDHDMQVDFDIAGATESIEPNEPWFCTVDESEWGLADPSHIESVKKVMQGEWGDRRCEVVCIGKSLNETELREMFEYCLLTDEEMAVGVEVWSKVPNPFMMSDTEDE